MTLGELKKLLNNIDLPDTAVVMVINKEESVIPEIEHVEVVSPGTVWISIKYLEDLD